MKHDEFIDELNKVKLKGFDNIPIGEWLSTIYFEYKGVGCLGLIKSILVSIILEQNLYFETGDTYIWMIATYSYYRRPDQQHQFENIIKCAKHKGVIIPNRKISFHIKRLCKLPLIIDWNKRLKNTIFNKKIRYLIIAEAFRALVIAEENVDRIKKKGKAKLCVTFCDVHPVDYLMTSMLHKHGIKTATLQHGVYDHMTRYEFSNSHSNYFLAMNEHAKEEAIRSGLNEQKIRVLGPLAYIDNKTAIRSYVKKEKVYGILLNGAKYGMLKGEDKELLDFGYNLSIDNKFKVIVRPHPLCEVPDHKIKNIEYYSECPRSVQLRDFLSQCDFVLTGSTTAFIDAFILGCPAYRYIGIHDHFPKVNGYSFCSMYQLTETIMSYYTKNEDEILQEIQLIRQYFIPKGNIKENYELFFKEFYV